VAMEDCEVAIRTKSAIISKVVIIPKVAIPVITEWQQSRLGKHLYPRC